MADETTKTVEVPDKKVEVPDKKVEPPKPIAEIERNGVSVMFDACPYSRGDMKKNNVTFAYPSIFDATRKIKGPDGKVVKNEDGSEKEEFIYPLEKVVTFIGEKNLRSMVAGKFTLTCQNWGWEASNINEEGTLPVDNMNTPHDWDQFVKFVQEFSARGETKAELNDKLLVLVKSFGSGEFSPEELVAKMAEAQQLTKAIEDKKRKKAENNA